MTFDEWFAAIPLRPELPGEWRESVRALCWVAWGSGLCLTATKKTDDASELDRLRAELNAVRREYAQLKDAVWNVPGEPVAPGENDTVDHAMTVRQAIDQSGAFQHFERLQVERNRLLAEAELYRRGYEAMGAADISNYLANCAAVPKLREDIDDAAGPDARRLQAENEHLKVEAGYVVAAEWRDKCKAAEAERDRLRAENEALRGNAPGAVVAALFAPAGELAAALRPFAELSQRWADSGFITAALRDDCPMPNSGALTLGDCRRAAEVLARYDAETKEQPK